MILDEERLPGGYPSKVARPAFIQKEGRKTRQKAWPKEGTKGKENNSSLPPSREKPKPDAQTKEKSIGLLACQKKTTPSGTTDRTPNFPLSQATKKQTGGLRRQKEKGGRIGKGREVEAGQL